MITASEAKAYIKLINDQHKQIKVVFDTFTYMIKTNQCYNGVAADLRNIIIEHLHDEDLIIIKIKDEYPTYKNHIIHHKELIDRYSAIYNDVITHNLKPFQILDLIIDFSNYIMNIEYYDDELIIVLNKIIKKSKIFNKIKRFFGTP